MKTKTQLFFIKSVLPLICVFIFSGFLMLNLNLKAFAATQSEQAVAKIGNTEYVDLKAAFSELSTNGGTLEFMENIVVDLSEEDWGDVSLSKQVIIEGNGATIIGLNRPLIMNAMNTTIKNLTIKDSAIQGLYTSHCNWDATSQSTAGAFLGFSQTSRLENCHLLNSTVASNEYCGGLIGYTSGSVKIVNCSVKNSTIEGKGSTGGMVGHSNGLISVTGTVSGNTVISNSANPEGWQGVVFGVLTGSIGNDISVVEETPSTSGNQSSIQIIGGRLTDVEFVGGKYFSNPAISGPNEYNNENADAVFSGSNGIVANPDGTFTIEQVEAVATILGDGQDVDDKSFSKDALKNAFEQLMANGGTLEFVQGVEIDLSLVNWGNMTTSKDVVINGNGATITGLDRPLITNALSASNVAINNLTIQASTIEGYKAGGSLNLPVTGAFIGYAEGEATLNACKTVNCTIISDDYAGGLIGYACSGSKKIEITDCSVLNSTIKGEGVGGMVGHATGNIFLSGTVGNNTITSTDKYQKEGSLVGTINASDGSRINVVEIEKSKGALTAQNGTELYPVGRLYNSCTYLGGSYFSEPTKKTDGTGVAVAPYIIDDNGKYVIATAIIDTTDDGVLNGDFYTSLNEAIENATAGQIVTLWQSVAEDITVDKNITIDIGENTVNGKVMMPNEVLLTIKGTSTENNIVLPELLKDHHSFAGWYSDPAFANEALLVNNTITVAVDNGTTFYAKFEKSAYVEIPKFDANNPDNDRTFDFGSKDYGLSCVEQSLTFVYNGEPEQIENAKIVSIEENLYFETSFDGLTVTIVPKSNLTVGTYEEFIHITMHDGSTHTIIAKLAVNKANAVINVDTSDIVAVQGQEWQLPAADTNVGVVKTDKTVDDMRAVGVYTVTYSVDGTDNYEGDSKQIKVTVILNPADVQDNVDKLEKELNDAIAELNTAINGKATPAEIQSAADTLTEAYKNADEALKLALQGEINANATAVANLQTALTNAESTLDTAIKKVAADLETAKNNLQSQIDTLTTSAGTNATDIAALEQAISDLDAAYQAADALMDGRLDALEAADTTIKASISSLETALAAAESKLQAAITQVQTNLNNAKAELEKAIAQNKTDLTAEITNLKLATEAADAVIKSTLADLATEDADIRASITALTNDLTDAKSELEMLITSTKTELQGKIEDVKSALETAKTDLTAAIAQNKTDLTAEINALKTAMENADALINGEIAELENKDAAIEADITVLENSLAGAKSALETAITQVQSNLDTAVGNLNNAIVQNKKDLAAEIEAVKNALTNADALISGKIADLVAEDTAINASISSLESSIANTTTELKGSIDTVAKNLETAKSELNTAIVNGSSALDEKITALDGAYKAADTIINSALAELVADDEEMNASITTLEASLATVKSELEAAIAQVQKNLSDTKKALEEKDKELDERLSIIVAVISAVAAVSVINAIASIAVSVKKRRK